MTVNMKTLERKHFLKHYLGGFAMVLGEDSFTGQIEQIDMEDGSVLLKSGEISRWFPGELVTPSVKSFADFVCNKEDIATVIDHLKFKRFDGSYLNIQSSNILHIHSAIGDSFVFVELLTCDIVIDKNWIVSLGTNREAQKQPDNATEIVFLLCELGYDVTGYFKS